MPDIDFGIIDKNLHQIDDRLKNWAAWATQRSGGQKSPGIWKFARSNWRQWHVPELRPEIDELDALKIEKTISAKLPDKNKRVIVWWYIKPISIIKARAEFAMTQEDLYKCLQDSRHMVKNLA